MSLSNNRKLDFFNASSKLNLEAGSINLFLDINQKDKILDASYTLEGEQTVAEDFNSRVESLKGLSIDSLDSLRIEDQKFSIFFHLANEAIKNFTDNHLVAAPKENLICRCYNISKNEILQSVNEGQKSLFEIANSTRATTGCGSCRKDIEAILKGLGNSPARLLNKTNAEWVLFFDALIDEFYNGEEKKTQIQKFSDGKLILSNVEDSKEVGEYLRNKSPIVLEISFS